MTDTGPTVSRKPASPATRLGRRIGRRNNSKQQKPVPANVSVHKPGEGGNRLLGAFNQVVAEYSLDIAKAIVKKVMQGDINGVRFLDEVTGAKAQRNQPPQKPHRQRLPWTPEHLAAEPNWHEPSDPEVDTGFGGRELEN
ncbi:MAG: hypothetical protein ABSE46_17385 [Terracidiphilus sp.]|jgi:hypothetical protein